MHSSEQINARSTVAYDEERGYSVALTLSIKSAGAFCWTYKLRWPAQLPADCPMPENRPILEPVTIERPADRARLESRTVELAGAPERTQKETELIAYVLGVLIWRTMQAY
jgi:hypothetical protein